MVLENDIHLDYENEIIIYPLKNCTRIIPFSSISYIDLLEENEHFIIFQGNCLAKRVAISKLLFYYRYLILFN